MLQAGADLPDIQVILNIPSRIRDGLQRHCASINYNYLRDQSNINEFCQGIYITGASFQTVERVPIQHNSENTRNATRHAAQVRERCRQARDVFRRTAQGITARLRPARFHVEVGGSCDIRNETRDNRSFERNDEHVVPPGVMRARMEEHYQEIIRYHVTLTAQADRTISVLSTRVLAAGGIGAAGGGLGGAAAGAGAGAAAGGVIGMIGAPIGAVIGAGVGAAIGGGIGLIGGLAGGAGAGVGIAYRQRPILLTCTAEDIFQNLEMSSNCHREGDQVIVEITGTYTCEGRRAETLLQEMGQH